MDTHSIQLRKGVSPVIGEIAQDLMEADRLKGKQLRENSVLSYRSDLKDLERYCVDRGFDLEFPVSVDVIRGYVGSRSRTHKKSTLERRLSGITKAHKLLGYKSPCKTDEVRMIMQGLGNDRDHKKTKAKALTMENLVPILAVWEGDDLHSIRNRALLLVGYAIASRQSELSRLAVDDLEFVDKGVIIDKRMTKTDKDNKGQIVGVSYVPDRNLCAVRALRLWLESAGITSGKVFRGIKCGGKIIRDKADRNGFMLHPQSVRWIIQETERRAGLPVRFSGHSLRAGHITDAYRMDVPEQKIQRTTGHKTISVLRQYEQNANPFDCSASLLNG